MSECEDLSRQARLTGPGCVTTHYRPEVQLKDVRLPLEAGAVVALFLGHLGTHVHDVGALVEDLHVGLQDVKVEGRCQQAAVTAPLVTFAEQQAVPWAQKTEVREPPLLL